MKRTGFVRSCLEIQQKNEEFLLQLINNSVRKVLDLFITRVLIKRHYANFPLANEVIETKWRRVKKSYVTIIVLILLKFERITNYSQLSE